MIFNTFTGKLIKLRVDNMRQITFTLTYGKTTFTIPISNAKRKLRNGP